MYKTFKKKYRYKDFNRQRVVKNGFYIQFIRMITLNFD